MEFMERPLHPDGQLFLVDASEVSAAAILLNSEMHPGYPELNPELAHFAEVSSQNYLPEPL